MRINGTEIAPAMRKLDRALNGAPGRQGPGAGCRVVAVALPARLRTRMAAIAANEGVTVAEVARRAVAGYFEALDGRGAAPGTAANGKTTTGGWDT